MVSPVKILHLQTIKREYIPAERLVQFLSLTPNVDRRIGSLPYDWIKTSGKSQIPDITRRTGDVFEKFAKEIDDIPDNASNEVKLKTAQQALVGALRKILGREDIKISYAGNGALKHCQRLDVGNYSYAFSTFKSKEAARKQFSDYFHKGQGRGNEPQTIFIAYNRDSHGRWAKPFMANMSGADDKGGFILSKFIDSNYPAKRRFGSMEKQRKYIYNFDPNYIHGVCIEAGGCVPNKKYIQNSKERDIWLRFAKIIDGQVALLKKREHNAEVYQILVNASRSGEDIVQFDTGIFSKEERKVADRVIRTLVKVRELKEKLTQEGKFENIRKLLNEDMIDAFPYSVYSEEFGSWAAKWYPHLIADELGISNAPELDEMMSISSEYNDEVKINFAKHYPKSEVIKWLQDNLVPERDVKLFENLQEQYGVIDLQAQP